MTLTDDDLQAIAKEKYGIAGFAMHLAPAPYGSDANDGKSFLTPKLSLKSNVEALVAGDAAVLAPGTYALGNAVCNTPDGVAIFCAGRTLTTITSSAIQAQINKGCAVRVPSNGTVRNCRVSCSHVLGAPIGYSFAGFGAQAVTTNGEIVNVDTDGDADGLYLDGDGGSITARNCRFRAKFDSVAVFGNGIRVDLYDPEVETSGPSATGASSPSHGIWTHTSDGSSVVHVYRGRVKATNGNTGQDTIGVLCGDGSTPGNVNLHETAVYSTNAAGTALDLKLGNSSGALTVREARYDPSKTSGTITVANAPINGAGQVASAALQAADLGGKVLGAGSGAITGTGVRSDLRAVNGGAVEVVPTVPVDLSSLASATGLIVYAPATGTSVDLIRADSYQDADGRAITITKQTNETFWPTTISTVDIYAKPTDATLSDYPSAASLGPVTGTVLQAAGSNQSVRIDLTGVQVASLQAATKHANGYTYWIIANRGTNPATLRTGPLNVRPDYSAT